MLSSVFLKSTRERAVSSLVLAGAFVAFALLGMAVYSGVGDDATSFTEDLPEAFDALIGGGDLSSPTGYVTSEMFGMIAPLMLAGFAIATGASAIAGEERDGTMGLLMSLPLSRVNVYRSKAAMVGVVVIGISAVMFLGTVGAVAVTGTDLPTGDIAAVMVHLVFLAAAFGAFALALGAFSGNTTVAAGTASAVMVASYLTTSLMPLTDFGWVGKLTPWYYYDGNTPTDNGIDVVHLCVLAGLTAICLGAGAWGIRHRDLKG